MATSGRRRTVAARCQTNEKMVLVQDSGDAANELVLEQQDADARGGGFLSWAHSAWNDMSVSNDIGDEIRPYVLGATVAASILSHLLGALASWAERDILQAILTFLGDVMTAGLCLAMFSYVTRFNSRLAAKAHVAKRGKLKVLLLGLLAMNAGVLVLGFLPCFYVVCSGLARSLKAMQEVWYQRLLVVFLWLSYVGAIGSFPVLVALMVNDVVATFRTLELHWPEMKEARKAFTKRWLHPPALLTAIFTVVCFFVIIRMFWIPHVFGVSPKHHATPPARGDI
ncbi:uncharacterized protein LOC119167855 [Rhipicephalus microplus]|uniref:uncharacterized protein LOC119167855 n=1 Tax=Rhipicephalus microplus TaxID=6941 RepID=UPI003F6A92DA